MKKIFITSALIAASAVSAQIDFSSTRFGITGGYNYSRVRNAHNPSGPRHTFQAGVLALIPVDNNDQFYLQPEITYYGAGETGKDKDAKNRPGYDALYAINYISVPVFAKVYFSESESEFFGMIGPRFNFMINEKTEKYPENKPYYSKDTEFGDAAKFHLALAAGLGFSYKRQLEVALHYDFGISNTYPHLKNSPDANVDNAAKLHKAQHIAGVTLNYIFQ